MSIQALLDVLPPPAAPCDAFDSPWDSIVAELGTALPQDYKDFVRLYGSGYFMEFLAVLVPRSSEPNMRLESQVGLICSTFADFDEEDLPFEMWPAAGGLVPFGSTDNGDYLFWLAQGEPEAWRVIIWDRGTLCFETLECSLSDFLAGLITGEVAPDAFPDLLPCDELFQPNNQ